MSLTLIAVILAAIQTLYAILTFHRDRSDTSSSRPLARPFALIGFTVLTWAAVGADYYDRHYRTEEPQEVSYLVNWGVREGNAIVVVDTSKLTEYKDEYKLAFIVRVPYSDIDRMTDNAIAKSDLSTITGGVISMEITHPTVHISNPKESPIIEFDVVLIPTSVSTDQVKSLADVDRLGGKIITTGGMQLPPAP